MGGRTALHAAVRVCNPSVVRLLLAAGAPVDAQDGNGCTALHHLAGSPWFFRRDPACLEALRDLLENGASTRIQDSRGQTARDVALEEGFEAAVELLDSK